MASGDCMGRKIQDGAGREYECSDVVGARISSAVARRCPVSQAGHSPIAGADDSLFRPAEGNTGAGALLSIGYAMVRVFMILVGLQASEFRELGWGLLATFLRVNFTLLLGALWTIPVGVAIGFNPRLARIAQPLAQIAASVPATALFPVVLLVLIRLGGGLGVGSIVLLLLGTQWYILFNVIAGAMAIPTDLKEAADVFGINGWERWRK